MDDKVVSIRPQILCGKLAKKVSDFLRGQGDPEAILALCDETMLEIGAVRNAAGEWALPDDSASREHEPQGDKHGEG